MTEADNPITRHGNDDRKEKLSNTPVVKKLLEEFIIRILLEYSWQHYSVAYCSE